MTATNHALTGAIIGLTISNPVVAIPLALLSHYVLDALPHYRPDVPEEQLYRSKGFALYLIAEASLCFLLVITLVATRPTDWLLASVCAFVAAAPDLFSIPIYRRIRSGKKKSMNAYMKFASGIQWFEKPTGVVVEAAWLFGALVILAKIL